MSSPLRVTHVFTAAESLTFLGGQTAYMREHGVEFSAIVSPGPSAERWRRQDGIRVELADMPRQITPLRDLRAIVSVARLIRMLAPSIVHSNTPKGGLIGTLAAFVARAPHRIYHMRGLPLETAGGVKRALLWSAEWLTCRFAHVVICESASLRARAIQLRLCSPQKAILLGNGSNGVDVADRYAPRAGDADAASATRAEWGVSDDDIVIGFVGRLANDKGVGELIAAWARVRERCPRARLVVVGPVDERDPFESDRFHTLQRDPRVSLLGHLEDCRPSYNAFDVCVLPSYREGFPNVLLEAAAMSLPIVTTTATGCIDAVEDGVTGTLVPVGAVNELAEALERYCSDEALRLLHGSAGRARVVRLFDRRIVWAAALDLYRRLAGTP